MYMCIVCLYPLSLLIVRVFIHKSFPSACTCTHTHTHVHTRMYVHSLCLSLIQAAYIIFCITPTCPNQWFVSTVGDLISRLRTRTISLLGCAIQNIDSIYLRHLDHVHTIIRGFWPEVYSVAISQKSVWSQKTSFVPRLPNLFQRMPGSGLGTRLLKGGGGGGVVKEMVAKSGYSIQGLVVAKVKDTVCLLVSVKSNNMASV